MVKAAPQNPTDNPVDAGDPENVKVSYSRFKETLDQNERSTSAVTNSAAGKLSASPLQPPLQQAATQATGVCKKIAENAVYGNYLAA